CMLAGVHFCFSGFFIANDQSMISFIHNIISIIVIRIPGASLASKYFPDNLTPMGMAAPIGSTLSIIICVAAYVYFSKKGRFGEIKRPQRRK
ncbi:MAG: MATE family efflux transporter, partial [Eubacteriales bacterium]|nr:MATE family efflux transporter [Eubacteriales bacterium]